MAFLSKSNQQKRKDPLLPQTKAHADATTGGSDIKATTEKCGTCGRLTLLLLPIFGCSMILSVLYLLVFRLDIKVSNSTVSAALADYEPTYEILLLLCTGAFAMFVVTAARNIQINVYHRRQKSSSTCQQLVNFVAALANIVAYFGFIILAAYPIDSEVAREPAVPSLREASLDSGSRYDGGVFNRLCGQSGGSMRMMSCKISFVARDNEVPKLSDEEHTPAERHPNPKYRM
eukprot:scaffold5681_cov196-Alexandrium_tamarense.AAC.34